MQRQLLAALPLVVSFLPAQGVPEGAEPNNTTARPAVLPAGAQAYGDVDTSGTDEDWFRITLPAAADYKIWTGPGFSGQIGDTIVRIYAADGVTVLTEVDDGNVATHGYYSTFQGTLPAGDYYVAVRGFDSTTFGSYTLDVVLAPLGTYVQVAPPLTAGTEGPENNDPRPAFGGGTATPTAFFVRYLGNIVAGGSNGTGITKAGSDYDWYEVQIPAPGSYVFRTTPTPLAPAPFVDDTVLHFCDATFTRLTFNDDFGGTPYSQLTQNITVPGTYYVVVSGYYGTSAGNYFLDVLGLLPPLPVGAGSVNVRTGGCAGPLGVPRLGNRLSSTGTNVRPEVPILGTEFWLDGTNLPPNSLVFLALGILPLPLPFNLGLLGAPGCQVEVRPIASLFGVSDAAGVFFWGFGSPADVAYLGLPVEQQLVVLDPPANALGLTTSNRVSSVFGVTH
ncbi:MAG: hypothetical protein FJ265_21845 [Planctomycetes bacterium]|nr:hypothetical protein [Planctomycetota bacterium]